MFLLMGLGITAIIAVIWLIVGAHFLNALARKRHLQAIRLGLSVFGLVFLIIGGISYGNWKAEAEPEAVFKAVFSTPPPPDVRALRGYHDDDELSPAFLSFQASPTTVAQLTQGKFSPLSPIEKATFSINDFHWNNPPAWLSTQITPQTQIYRENKTLPESNHLLFYEPNNKTVRVYFKVIGVENFWN